ncbi:cyclic nucleotide-binding protein [Oleiagrimonas sp. MCCC 1A03011]|nr:cyclic nucleotide-binding protein [Oleiagrimonas sp. MCCC 1A03011]
METELEKLPADEREIVERFIRRKHIARNVLKEFDQSMSFGERLSDRIAEIGGSWTFILLFLFFLAAWMVFNSFVLHKQAFDPYPYILLNLALSCLAALQAPVIMMSQNRQADADRAQAKNDYEVNVRAELEILQVHEKINATRETELTELLEIARRQEEMIGALQQRLAASSS